MFTTFASVCTPRPPTETPSYASLALHVDFEWLGRATCRNYRRKDRLWKAEDTRKDSLLWRIGSVRGKVDIFWIKTLIDRHVQFTNGTYLNHCMSKNKWDIIFFLSAIKYFRTWFFSKKVSCRSKFQNQCKKLSQLNTIKDRKMFTFSHYWYRFKGTVVNCKCPNYFEFLLYICLQDELDDNGCTKLSYKIRVMPSGSI